MACWHAGTFAWLLCLVGATSTPGVWASGTVSHDAHVRSRCNVRPHLGPSGTRWGPSGVARAVHAAHAAHMLCPPGPLGHHAVPARHAQIVPTHRPRGQEPAASASKPGIWPWSRFQTGPVRQPPGPVGRPAGILAPCTKAVRSRRHMCQGGFRLCDWFVFAVPNLHVHRDLSEAPHCGGLWCDWSTPHACCGCSLRSHARPSASDSPPTWLRPER